MCYIVFISHSLHLRYIKTALQEYVINTIETRDKSFNCFGYEFSSTLQLIFKVGQK